MWAALLGSTCDGDCAFAVGPRWETSARTRLRQRTGSGRPMGKRGRADPEPTWTLVGGGQSWSLTWTFRWGGWQGRTLSRRGCSRVGGGGLCLRRSGSWVPRLCPCLEAAMQGYWGSLTPRPAWLDSFTRMSRHSLERKLGWTFPQRRPPPQPRAWQGGTGRAVARGPGRQGQSKEPVLPHQVWLRHGHVFMGLWMGGPSGAGWQCHQVRRPNVWERKAASLTARLRAQGWGREASTQAWSPQGRPEPGWGGAQGCSPGPCHSEATWPGEDAHHGEGLTACPSRGWGPGRPPPGSGGHQSPLSKTLLCDLK